MKIKKVTIYRKFFIIYTLIILFLISTLDIYFSQKILQRNKENVIYLNEKIIYDISEVLNDINKSSKVCIDSMYTNYDYIKDVSDFLKMNKTAYLENKLNKLSESKLSFYKGIEYFTQEAFISNEELESITFFSYTRNEINIFNKENQITVKTIEENPSVEDYGFTKENNEEYINFPKIIRNPETLKEEGIVKFTYNLRKIQKIYNKYNQKPDIKIINQKGICKYDSTGEYTNQQYLYFDKLTIGRTQDNLEKGYCINSLETSNFTIIGRISNDAADKLTDGFYISLILVDLVLLAIGEAVFYFKFKNLSYRLDNILDVMDEVKSGNIDVSIPIGKEQDEINFIAQNFNEMCLKLNDYINKSYLAEIKEKQAELNQKKAEMNAIQSQINPHFLYNTLESIRMKAILNGDKEVGKMLYILALLFRSQLKDKEFISIKSELDYCNKYLEIYKFRYDEKFKYEVECDEQLLNKEIIKFTIQPIIENYFVHGIRRENNDNLLEIRIARTGKEKIEIKIKDNGKGISKVEVMKLNSILMSRDANGSSIGIVNVNERIVMAYGDEYGIRFNEKLERGTEVSIIVPCVEVREYA